jgi:hypothetical protein
MKTMLCALVVSLLLLPGVALAAEGDVEITLDNEYKTITHKPELQSRDTTEVIIGVPAFGNYIPFWGSTYDAMRFQVLFLQSEINTLGDIVTFSWNPSTPNTGSFNNIRVYMCHTSATQLTSTFDNNYMGNTPVELINEPTMVVGGPAGTWYDWDVYFPYNNMDNLLVEVRWNGDGGLGIPMYRTTEAVERRVWAPDDNASTGTTQFTGQYVRLYLTPPAAQTFWDFEDGLQGWTHTNGQPFPGGWDVEASGLHATYTPPDAGDSTMWIDSDAAGFVTIYDTAYSPAVVPPASMTWLKYGLGFYQYTGGNAEWVSVGVREFSSGAWQPPVELRQYTSSFSPAWESLDVTAYQSAESLMVFFSYNDANYEWYAAFDNVSLAAPPGHDVGCFDVVSPAAGTVAPGNYDVIGWIRNVGGASETFDVVAHVYDTVGMVLIFDQTINLTLDAGSDTNLDFGQVTFDPDKYFYTEIYTMLGGDEDPGNDTSSVYSWTAIGLGDVIFELDAQAIVNDNQLLGIEFDGERFYITGGGNATDPNKVYVVDTAGTLLWSLDQPSHSTGWGWRDIAWDDVYVGPDRIDTLYASVNTNVDKFSIDLVSGILTYHGFSPGAQNPNRALAYKPDSGWFYTANFSSSCYKFNKQGVILQSVPNTLAMYGAAYDGDLSGPYVWWHSQDNPGTGFLCQITEMDAMSMAFGSYFGFEMPASLTDAIAGGLCYYSNFRGMDVLFALLQGTPNDYIVGIFVRPFTGVEGKPGAQMPLAFGFAPTLATVSRGRMPIAYTTTAPSHVSLKVYDNMGRLVQTLVNAQQPAGEKSVYWDSKDLNKRTVSNGVYFLKLEAEGETAVHKLILVR